MHTLPSPPLYHAAGRQQCRRRRRCGKPSRPTPVIVRPPRKYVQIREIIIILRYYTPGVYTKAPNGRQWAPWSRSAAVIVHRLIVRPPVEEEQEQQQQQQKKSTSPTVKDQNLPFSLRHHTAAEGFRAGTCLGVGVARGPLEGLGPRTLKTSYNTIVTVNFINIFIIVTK